MNTSKATLFLTAVSLGIVLAGIALDLVGVAILVWPGDVSLAGVEPIHLAAVGVSPVCWAIGSLFAARRARLPDRPLVATGLQMALGGAMLAAMSVAAGEPAGFEAGAVSVESAGALLYLIVLGSLVAFTVYAWLIQVAPLGRVTTYAYVNPVVAVILGEPSSWGSRSRRGSSLPGRSSSSPWP
jgi:drug/metabolite transporter (DMT)-like permease